MAGLDAGGVLHVVRDPGPLGAETAAAVGPALLRRCASDGGPALLRLYRPRPTVAFSRRDTHAPGFDRACEAAERHGFAPVVRATGGRAAAYHEASLVLEHVAPDARPHPARERFVQTAELLTAALRSLGVDARVGAVPGEYCPGEFSVNDAGRTKLVGTAQRVVRGGWLFGIVVLVGRPDPVRAVLEDVYPSLGLDWDPGTVGAVTDTLPDVGVDDVERALLHEYSRVVPLKEAAWPAHVLRDVDLAAALPGGAPDRQDSTAQRGGSAIS